MGTTRGWRVGRAVVTVLGALACAVLGGWGADGHRVVGQIAASHLNTKAKAEVEALLGDLTLADASTWADDIRGNHRYDWARLLHYVNVERGDDAFDLETHCPDEGCVVQAIITYTETLKSASASREEKIEALKFLVHFVGDVHQPLHVGYADDKGGNDIKVKFFNRQAKLHAVWDTLIIQRIGESWQDLAARLDAGISDADRAQWGASPDPEAWANESFQLAVSHAYRDESGGPVVTGDVLGQVYFDLNRDVVEERLAMAGVRLAALLNEIYPEAAAPAPSGVQFVGSRRSNVYHVPTCKIVEEIDPHNLVEYAAAPTGKRLHKNCPW